MKLLNYLFIFIIIQSGCVKEFTNQVNQESNPLLIIDAFINDIPLPPNFNYYNDVEFKFNEPIQSFDTLTFKHIRNPNFKYAYLTDTRYNYQETVWEFFNSCVKLRLSNGLFDPDNKINKLITNAKVVLKDDMGNIDTMRECGDPLYIKTTNRYTQKGEFRLQHLQPTPGHTYFLEVYYNGKKYTAQSFMPQKSTIDSIDINLIPNYIKVLVENKVGIQPIIHIKPNKSNSKNYYYFKKPDGLTNFDNNQISVSYFHNVLNLNVIEDNTIVAKKLDGYQTWVKGKYNYLQYLWPTDFTNFNSDSINSEYYQGTIAYIPNIDLNLSINNYNTNFPSRSLQLFNKYKSGNISLDELYFLRNISMFNENASDFGFDLSQNYPIYFGSIDEKAYNYFKQLKDLFLNDGGSYTPTPNTPNTNIQGGAIGYFYTSSGIVTEIPGSSNSPLENFDKIKACVVFPDGSMQINNFIGKFNTEILKNYLPDFKIPTFFYVPPLKPF